MDVWFLLKRQEMGLAAWMQVPKSTKKSTELLESQSLLDGSGGGSPTLVIMLLLIG